MNIPPTSAMRSPHESAPESQPPQPTAPVGQATSRPSSEGSTGAGAQTIARSLKTRLAAIFPAESAGAHAVPDGKHDAASGNAQPLELKLSSQCQPEVAAEMLAFAARTSRPFHLKVEKPLTQQKVDGIVQAVTDAQGQVKTLVLRGYSQQGFQWHLAPLVLHIKADHLSVTGPANCKGLADAMAFNRTLSGLTLRENKVTVRGLCRSTVRGLCSEFVAELARTQGAFAALRSLTLESCMLSNADVREIAAFLRRTPGLEALNLNNNAFGDAGAEALAEVLPDLNLGRILINDNPIARKGWDALGQGWQAMCRNAIQRSTGLPNALVDLVALYDNFDRGSRPTFRR